MARILVIDDDPHIRTIIEAFLMRDDHEIDLAENGVEGLKQNSLREYDMVITDIIMPIKDGFEVVMELKQLFPHIRIIAMSGGTVGLDSSYLLKTAHLMGADRVLTKPLDFKKLQMVVNEVLALPQLINGTAPRLLETQP